MNKNTIIAALLVTLFSAGFAFGMERDDGLGSDSTPGTGMSPGSASEWLAPRIGMSSGDASSGHTPAIHEPTTIPGTGMSSGSASSTQRPVTAAGALGQLDLAQQIESAEHIVQRAGYTFSTLSGSLEPRSKRDGVDFMKGKTDEIFASLGVRDRNALLSSFNSLRNFPYIILGECIRFIFDNNKREIILTVDSELKGAYEWLRQDIIRSQRYLESLNTMGFLETLETEEREKLLNSLSSIILANLSSSNFAGSLRIEGDGVVLYLEKLYTNPALLRRFFEKDIKPTDLKSLFEFAKRFSSCLDYKNLPHVLEELNFEAARAFIIGAGPSYIHNYITRSYSTEKQDKILNLIDKGIITLEDLVAVRNHTFCEQNERNLTIKFEYLCDLIRLNEHQANLIVQKAILDIVKPVLKDAELMGLSASYLMREGRTSYALSSPDAEFLREVFSIVKEIADNYPEVEGIKPIADYWIERSWIEQKAK